MILFTSDHHHHSYQSFSHTTNKGINSRLQETLDIEDYIHGFMVEKNIKTHIRLGDLFDKKNVVDAVVYGEVMERIRNNYDAGIEEIILEGNHDQAQGETRSTLEPLHLSRFARVISEPTHIYQDGLDFCIVPHMGSGRSHKQALEEITKKYKRCSHKILLGHFGIHGAKLGSEFMLPEYLKIEDLYLDQYQYGFFGHIHERQYLTGNSMYIGSFSQRNFSDSGSPRRAVLLNGEEVTSITLPGPQFVTMHIRDEEDVKNFLEKGKFTNSHYIKIKSKASISIEKLVEKVRDEARGFTIQYIPEEVEVSSTHIHPSQGWKELVHSHTEPLYESYGEQLVKQEVEKAFEYARRE